MERQQVKELTLTRVFDAPRELVFKAWTDPGLLSRWWGPTYFTNPVCELDLRPGGSIYIVMRDPDGVDYPMKGVFREIVPPERLVFSSTAIEDAHEQPQLETLVTVTLAEENNQTKQTVHVVVIKATQSAQEALSGMEAGWNQSLDKLTVILK